MLDILSTSKPDILVPGSLALDPGLQHIVLEDISEIERVVRCVCFCIITRKKQEVETK